MYRGTTPTLQIACDLDLDTCQTVWLTLQQGCCEITKQRADMTPTTRNLVAPTPMIYP